jgi:2-methylcitrate dehydratase PrpD
MVEIKDEINPVASDVEKIFIEIDNLPLDAAGIKDPKNLHEGRFSIYFLAALALSEGKVTTENLTAKKILDPEINTLKNKIETKGLDGVGLSSFVQMQMKNGRMYQKRTPAPKGSSENPLSPGELQQKFIVTSGLPPAIAEQVIEKVMCMEDLESMDEIISLL